MCGIAGWIDFGRDLTQERAIVDAMTQTMACRGPDADGVWLGQHAAIGHRRLSVIDLAGGRQPMTAEQDGRTLAVLTFSGEIYNYRELRADLISRGHRFRTESDTEVVLRGYVEWGEGVVDKLNGMFAFGIWDVQSQELLLVRDRMGVKPLYYYPTANGVLFGSEPKVILAHPDIPRRVNANGLRELLDMVKTPEHAIFTGMYEIRPGHTVRVRRQGLVKRRYWALEAKEHTDSLETTIETVRRLLDDTVSRQLISDVPLCSLLSGGLDSSAVTALAAKALAAQGGGPVRSFSVDFVGAAENFVPDPLRSTPDTPFVRDLAQHVAAEHREILLNSDDLSDPGVRAAVLAATDLPPMWYGDLWPSLYLLFKAVRERSTVALSGESADELFGGYSWFHDPEVLTAETFPWLTSTPGPFYDGTPLFDSGLLGKLDIPGYRRSSYGDAIAEVPVLPGEMGLEKRMREISYLNLTRFLNTLLDRKDRMSMAVGLEVRVPFCDHRLVEYVFNAPWAMKTFDGREKSLLRAATRDVLPESIVKRVKAPYPSTQDSGYEKKLRDRLAEVLSGGDAPILSLLDKDRVRGRLDGGISTASTQITRIDLEVPLWFNAWLESYDVTIDL
ncbi:MULTISPECIES: asparagine synthase (glutamine-hydrolyzing) [unclassified Streptomyces]|uniref:asparagine synthase (glutamine-hydrolyzing) n=1 Tax=unclassified Streptomyces TaxID=2593676 RepID=UPI000DAE42F8|nr:MULTISPECIES: asparagine synthase (glutamine-hydrolyzing) [unclassified Streptomyces]PZT73821.1 asparagine synthase (glutamine-hydrolyzing) [Streptomyces sp. AC1-42T]PZT83183.1 asparagine synthase (glutamine-hydrolyzing) [Streptomyces sp. AC1-42W]